MTVKQLILELQKLDPEGNKDVIVWTSENREEIIEDINILGENNAYHSNFLAESTIVIYSES